MTLCERFQAIGEFYAAGLFEEEDRSTFYCKALAIRRFYENCPLPEYHGEKLYPSGNFSTGMAVTPHYCNNAFSLNANALKEKDDALLEILYSSRHCDDTTFVPREHSVAGNMFNHSMPNYERILAEGFNSYEERVKAMSDPELREGLLHVLAGIRAYHTRCVEYLVSVNADAELIHALRRVPFEPCENITQAIVGWNFILYLDGCDNLGSTPLGLAPYYKGEDVSELLENLFRNLDDCGGYSMSAGMQPSPLTVPCLKAVLGKRRPMIELFVDENTPDDVWDAALTSVLSGNGQPAFYNRKLYRSSMKSYFPHLADKDLDRICGGGCTEMMVPGLSHVGSLDAGLNLLLVLEETMAESLESAPSFEAFYETYLHNLHDVAISVMESISKTQEYRAAHRPLPMRTLLTDDCIDRETEYTAGGPRYGWSIISFAGIVNTIDSLLVIRDRVFRERKETPAEFLQKLRDNDPVFLNECKHNQNRHGIDNDDANQLAYNLTHTAFAFLKERKPRFGTDFLPSSILFQAYEGGGLDVGATPDGRCAREPLADSLSAIFGKDTDGPTAMLKSVAAMDLAAAPGTPVVNLTINPTFDRSILKQLVLSFLSLGGMQLQISCLNREQLEKAYRDPDAYPNLIVRVGGYSEYFCRLSDALKLKVLSRTFFA